MKCSKCNFVTFDWALDCPMCQKSLAHERSQLGIFFEKPEVTWDDFFLTPEQSTSSAGMSAVTPRDTVEVDPEDNNSYWVDGKDEEFEFNLDE